MSEFTDAWKGFIANMTMRGLKAPSLAIVDGGAGLTAALALTWKIVPRRERCTVHKLRNLARNAPQHAYGEIKADFPRRSGHDPE